MITAAEARKKNEENEDKILNSPRFKYIFNEIERRIKDAVARGDRSISWYDYVDPKMYIAYNGDEVFKNKLLSLGYSYRITDHGHFTLSW